MNAHWLKAIIRDKDKEVKVGIVVNGIYEVRNIVAVEDENDETIILSTNDQRTENIH